MSNGAYFLVMKGNTVTINSIRIFIDNNKMSVFQWKVIIICFFIVMLDGFDISIVAYLAPVLKKEMGLSSNDLSYLFVSGVLGLMLGSMIFGPIADKCGRKKILIISTFLYGFGAILCGLSSDFYWLVFFRLMTGIGLGAAMPICITLCSEYSPKRYRMLLCTLSWSGFTVGIASGGVMTNWILQYFSWHWLFYLGGILPLLSIPIIALVLPESFEYLVKKKSQKANAQLKSIISNINKNISLLKLYNTDSDTELFSNPQTISIILGRKLAVLTVFLWIAFFFSLLVFYLLTYWLPVIFNEAYDYNQVNYMTSMLPLGGTLGALLLAIWIDYKKEAFLILGLSYFTAMILLLVIADFTLQYYGLLLIIFFIGFTIAGAQNGLNLISATVYPAYARATGVSWAMASGRLGSIVGSYSGAWLMTDAKIPILFYYLSIGAFLCSLALIMIFLIRKRRYLLAT